MQHTKHIVAETLRIGLMKPPVNTAAWSKIFTHARYRVNQGILCLVGPETHLFSRSSEWLGNKLHHVWIPFVTTCNLRHEVWLNIFAVLFTLTVCVLCYMIMYVIQLHWKVCYQRTKKLIYNLVIDRCFY